MGKRESPQLCSSFPALRQATIAKCQYRSRRNSSVFHTLQMQTPSGNATSIRVYPDPTILVNISVWRSVEELKAYVYKSLHGDFLSGGCNGLSGIQLSILGCGEFLQATIPLLKKAKQNYSILKPMGIHLNVLPSPSFIHPLQHRKTQSLLRQSSYSLVNDRSIPQNLWGNYR